MQMQTDQMAGAGPKQSGLGRQGPWVLAALLFCLCLQPLHAQNTVPNLTEICGRTRFTGKIFGGQNAEPQQWPWQASLFLNGTYTCGAVLIDSNWVASAAHCFQRLCSGIAGCHQVSLCCCPAFGNGAVQLERHPCLSVGIFQAEASDFISHPKAALHSPTPPFWSYNPDDYQILLGYNRLRDPSNYSMQMTVGKLIVHPDFDKQHFLANDICLMQLHMPVKFNPHILPACLPRSSTKPDPKISCWISGWGMTVEEAEHTELLPPDKPLQEAKVSLLDSEDCNAYYRYPDPNTTDPRPVGVFEDMVCARDHMNGSSICRGDSGGPLVCPVEGVWYLFGLSSWSTECHSPIGPSVFTNLSYFADWIKYHKQEASTPSTTMAPPTQKHPALSPVLKPGMIALLSSQFLLLWLISFNAR
ncbi:serine protease 40-like [Sciurus carolinensis]|uniref:serine protease 40-like n=1 Tax=Sciurus carolinensis TaxID=30640 RepID=UPI001FB265BE|nr:serine protease 40-like [Sciurus carolinensis]